MDSRVGYVPETRVAPYIVFDPKICNGCLGFKEPACVRACRMDILIPNPKKGKPPILIYADECCECGCCVHACPRALHGAIKMNWPLQELVRWKDKKTGKHFRVGMPNPPPPNPKPPVSGWYPKTLKA